MLTGLEVATLRVVVTKLISELSTDQLNKKSDEILFDQKLADLMGVLFELNAKQALKNNERWERACTIRASINAVRGSRFTLFRYMSSRTVYSLAKSYQKQVEQDTAAAKMKAYIEKQKNMGNAHIRDHATKEVYSPNDHQRLPPSWTTENSTSQNSQSSSSTTTFVCYPSMGTPQNPAIHCPVGSEPTIPKGLRPGNIIFYPLSQASGHHSHASIHHSGTSMSDRSVDNGSELIAETDHLAEILVSVNNSNASIATTFYSLDLNNEADAGGSDCESSGDLTGDC
ncbi:hypothetical protein F5050DRAFT_1813341 [Lentinula boryana]|uniref:Uncharacterized protein n=1 Tax=Lentinula boryana TaxID=40481 RepID=A0ABQ8PWN7_9AGAR|nr:hypothetical protein F5050DRAFT_1813341 [Lentinula boryana]